MRVICTRATRPISELVLPGLLRVIIELYSIPIHPRRALMSGEGGLGTAARASSITGSAPVNVISCGYSRPPAIRCCCAWACSSFTTSGAKCASSPTSGCSLELTISHTADDAATEITCNVTMIPEGGGTGPCESEAGFATARSIIRRCPSFSPAARPPSRYTAP